MVPDAQAPRYAPRRSRRDDDVSASFPAEVPALDVETTSPRPDGGSSDGGSPMQQLTVEEPPATMPMEPIRDPYPLYRGLRDESPVLFDAEARVR